MMFLDNNRQSFYVVYAYGAFVIALAWMFSPLWLTKEWTMSHDAIMWYPIYQYFFNSLSDGVFPLWEPFLGTNFFGILNLLGCLDPVTFPLSLIAVLIRLTPYDAYVYLYIIKHLFFFCGTFYFYNTATQNNRTAALFGTFVLACAVIPFALRQNGFVHNSCTYVPWIFLGLLKLLNSHLSEEIRKRWVYWTALFAGASLYNYIPSYTITAVVLFTVILFIFKVFNISNLGHLFKCGMWKTLVKALVGLILMLAFILVLFHYLQDNNEFFPWIRIHQSLLFDVEKISKYIIDSGSTGLLQDRSYQQDVFSVWQNLAMLVVPWSDGLYFSYLNEHVKNTADLMDSVAFIGVIPFFFAMYAILFSRSRLRWPALVQACIIALLMTGTKVMEGHLLHTIYRLLPIANMVHVYENFCGIFLLNLCLLVVLGVAELQKNTLSKMLVRRFIITVAICIVTISSLLLMLNPLFVAYCKSLTPTYIHLGLAFFALCGTYIILRTTRDYTRRGFVICMLIVLSLVEILIHVNPLRSDSYSGFAMNINCFQKNDLHTQYQPLEYSPYRVAWLPVYGDFLTFQPLFYQIGTAYIQYSAAPGNFIFLPRYLAQYLYNTPFENQRYMSGVAVPKLLLTDQVFTLKNDKLLLDSLKNYSIKNIMDSTHAFPLLISDKECSGSRFEEGAFAQCGQQINYQSMTSHNFNFPVHFYSKTMLIDRNDFKEVSSVPFCGTEKGYAADLKGLTDVKGISNFPYSFLNKSTIGRFFVNYYTDVTPIDRNYFLKRRIVETKDRSPSVRDRHSSYNILGSINEKLVLFQGNLYTDMPQKVVLSWDDPPEAFSFSRMGDINVTDFGQNHIKVQCSVKKPCYLYYADVWSKFWSAYDNGSQTKLFRTNYTFKSVFLTPGEHIVEFVYNPPYLRLSLAISCIGFFLLFAGGLNHKHLFSIILSFARRACGNKSMVAKRLGK
jgi:hypothetical protein